MHRPRRSDATPISRALVALSETLPWFFAKAPGIGGHAPARGGSSQSSRDAEDTYPTMAAQRVGLDGPHRPPEQTPQYAPAFALDTRAPIMPGGNEQEINDVRFANAPAVQGDRIWEANAALAMTGLAFAAFGDAASDKKAGRPSPSDGHPALCAPLASNPPELRRSAI